MTTMTETRGRCRALGCSCPQAIVGDTVRAGYRICLRETCNHTVAGHAVVKARPAPTPATTPAPTSGGK